MDGRVVAAYGAVVKVWQLVLLIAALWWLVPARWRLGVFGTLILLVAVGIGPVA
jgi:hypothetical protein